MDNLEVIVKQFGTTAVVEISVDGKLSQFKLIDLAAFEEQENVREAVRNLLSAENFPDEPS